MRLPARHVLGPPLLLLVLALVIFRQAVAGGIIYERDVHLVWLPQVEVIVRALGAGVAPLWNPSAGFGEPLLANPEAQTLYPFTWLNLLFPPGTFYTLYATAHLLLGGLGVRALARTLKCSPVAATAAGALWMAAGPVLSLVNLWHHYAGACWMPWVLAAAERTFRIRRVRPALAWAALQALQLLAGSADMAVATLLLAAGRMLFHLDARAARGRSLRVLGLAALAVVLAVGASAAQWWPTVELARGSARWGGMSREARQHWSVHPWLLGQLVVPVDADALPLSGALRQALFDGGEPFLRSLYLGLPAAVLVAAALAHRRRRTLVLALLVVCVFGIAVALGRHARVHDVVVAVVPPLAAFRYPVKAMVPVALAWSLLAALGIDALRGVARRVAVVGALAAALSAVAAGALGAGGPGVWASIAGAALPALLATILVFASAAARLPGAGPLVLAGGLAVADLVFAHRHLNPVAPSALYEVSPAATFLRSIGARRVYVYDYHSVRGKAQELLGRSNADAIERAPLGWEASPAGALELHRYLYPPLPAAYGLDGSFDVDLRGLHPGFRVQLAHLLRATEGTPAHLRLLQLASVDAMVARHQWGLEDLSLRQVLPTLAAHPVRVYSVPAALPRAYVVGTSRRRQGLDGLALLIAPDFDPRQQVVVEAGVERTAEPGFAGEAAVTSRDAAGVSLRAWLNQPGLVVLTDAWAEGWTASVDGRPAAVVRANGAFRAVELGAGEHEVRLSYAPPGMALGMALSLGMLAAGGGLALVTGRRGLRRSAS